MKFYFMFSIVLISNILYSQKGVGINTNSPESTLEVQSKNSAIINIFSIKNNQSTIFEIDKNGDLNLFKALMPNDDAGKEGEILVSKGSDKPPIWELTPIENAPLGILNAAIKEPTEIIDNRLDSNNGIITFTEKPIIFNEIFSNIPFDIGTWDGEFLKQIRQVYIL